MVNKAKQHHNLGVVMLALTAMFWGAGFVLNDQLLMTSFVGMPSLLNAVRFVTASICMLVIFNKRIRLNWTILLYGGVGGLMLFGGFLMQLIALQYTTPAHSGFFTAAYIVFVPFVTWIVYKRRPSWVAFAGVGVAIVGFIILNLSGAGDTASETLLGDLLTIICAVLFALQIVWTDYALKKNKTDCIQMTFWQMTVAAILFVLYSVIFESKSYSSIQFDASFSLWRLAIVCLGGTSFAYYAQTFAQKHVSPTETSLILGCESPIGAVLSVIVGLDAFCWTLPVGGCLVVASIFLVEVAPSLIDNYRQKHGKKRLINDEEAGNDTPCDTSTDSNV